MALLTEPSPPGCGKAVAFREDVADDVGDGKQERSTIGDERPELDQLGGADVGDDQDAAEQRQDDRVVAARGEGVMDTNLWRHIEPDLCGGRGVAPPAGFEPATFGTGNRRSIP